MGYVLAFGILPSHLAPGTPHDPGLLLNALATRFWAYLLAPHLLDL